VSAHVAPPWRPRRGTASFWVADRPRR